MAESAMSPVLAADDCAAGFEGSYNLPLAIASVFIVFVASFLGFMAPAMIHHHAGRFARVAIVASSAAGTGVLLGVSLVHMLPDATESLASPCLSKSWNNAFPDWGPLICAATIMAMVILDFVLQGIFERRFEEQESLVAASAPSIAGASHASWTMDLPLHGAAIRSVSSLSLRATSGGSGAGAHHIAHGDNAGLKAVKESSGDGMEAGDADHSKLDAAALSLKRGAVIFIEASVCTHSIPVGLALGMQDAGSFVSLLLAVIVHQMLEGLGIGATALEAQYRTRTVLGLATAFSCTAPIGIAAGIGLRTVMGKSDATYLMTLGIVDAIAAGMLIYVALEHMNAVGSQGAWLRKQHWGAQTVVLLCFCFGGAAMLVIGKYA